METYILNIQSPFDSLEFVAITNQKSIQLVKNTLHENEGDYLEGAVELSYNGESIFSKNMDTTDLLLTWQTLIEPLYFPENKQYEIEFLDSIFDVKIQVSGEDYIIFISTYHNENETSRKTIPKHVYRKVIYEGFMQFATFIIDNQFTFTHESSYDSFMKDYEQIKKQSQI